MSELARTPDSPFDALMGEDGRWSARDLMKQMSYSRWQTLQVPLGRAMATASNQGLDVDVEFSQVTQVTRSGNLGNQNKDDYRLSRFAAYLLAMNGDPNKPEVAAAQAYFATKTREAEVAKPRELTRKELALLVIAAEEEKERLEAANAQLSEELSIASPKADKWERYVNAEGLIGMTELAGVLGMSAVGMTKRLVELNVFRVVVRNGRNSRVPRSKYLENGMFEMKSEVHNGQAVTVNYAAPSGADHVMDLLQHPLARQ